MKRAIIFTIAATLSGTALASGFENLKSNLNLAPLNTETIINAGFIIPPASEKAYINKKEIGNKSSAYFLQSDGVCRNAKGKTGYNKIAIDELLNNLQKGECADLSNLNLNGAYLQEANLKGANLKNTNLSGAELYKANLSMANLNKANLYNANLVKTDMTKANLQESKLRRSYLTRANLSGADLRRADLSEAYLHETNLKNTDLRMSNLKGALLKMTNLKKAKYLQRAKYNNRTQLPFGKLYGNLRGMIKVAN